MYINNTWELIGTTTIDLSDYVTETELTTALTPYVQTSALTTTLDDRYVNVTGDTMTGELRINNTTTTNGSIYTKTPSGDVIINGRAQQQGAATVLGPNHLTFRTQQGDSNYPYVSIGGINGTQLQLTSSDSSSSIDGVILKNVATPTTNLDAANKQYVDNAVAGISVPTISAASALTTGITTGTITINGTTTTFYSNQKYDVVIDYDSDNDEFSLHNSSDTFNSIIEKIQNGYDVELYINGDTVAHLDAYNEDLNEGYLIFSCWSPDSDYVKHSFSINSQDELDHWSTNYYVDQYIPPVSDPLFVNYYGVCAGDSVTRTLTVDSSFRLITGVEITVRFDRKVTSSNDKIYLSVNNTGSKQIVYTNNEGYDIAIHPVNRSNTWDDKSIIKLVYDGTHWVWINYPNKASTSEFGIVKVGDNIAVNSSGIISINSSNVISALGYTPANVSSIPSITATAGLTTGITIGTIDVDGTTTTFYAPEDTKVKQTDITGSTTVTGMYPFLLSDAVRGTTDTITSESLKTGRLCYSTDLGTFIVSGNGTANNGGFYINDYETRKNYVGFIINTPGTTDTTGLALAQIGNSTASGTTGNAQGNLVIYGQGERGNNIQPLDNGTGNIPGGSSKQYHNYLPMVDNAVLAAGVTTGVGSSTVPVYMAAGGELLACTLPTPTTYTMSMTGPTINLLADGVAASTITLPIWDGTVTLTDAGVVG